MVGAHNFRMDGGGVQLFLKLFGNDEVVNSPTYISLPCLCTVAPPAVFFFFRIKIAEGIEVAAIQYAGEFCSLFVGETGT